MHIYENKRNKVCRKNQENFFEAILKEKILTMIVCQNLIEQN